MSALASHVTSQVGDGSWAEALPASSGEYSVQRSTASAPRMSRSKTWRAPVAKSPSADSVGAARANHGTDPSNPRPLRGLSMLVS